jgi:8-oxo-dGTP pyrophosphatase MutT (NUDIX family)
MPVIPKKAATVILLRDKKLDGFEVFLLQRHEKSSFMGGNFVYPGGRVDRDDGSMEICSYSKGVTSEEAQKILGGAFSPDESLAYWIAAIRELYEEAGVLLAYDQRGDLLRLRNRDEQEKFSNYRRVLQKAEIGICGIAKKENLSFALDQLRYYAHWITPEARSERFDTYFFLARYPSGQEATHDQKETTAGIWITPREALQENLVGGTVLSPPTLKTLEDLARFKTIDEVYTSLNEAEIPTILPVLTKISSGPMLIFPWDPEYEVFRKGETPSPLEHGRPARPGDNTTRLLMKEGRWLPYCHT